MSEHQRDWPTPEFDRPDSGYECSNCGGIVMPDRGDPQAGLLIAGATVKLCAECARDLRDEIVNDGVGA